MKILSKGKQKIIASAIILSLQLPTLACYAATVTPDASVAANAPAVTDAAGVPVVNIVKPNENGLSHNKFTDFNVGTSGLIFNNNAGNTALNSQLAGKINPNANLGGQAAGIILNEVTGKNISNLNGMMEVVGNKAAIIIANPNGIVGNGFGFINTSRATLVAGTPNIDGGKIDSFTIDSGKITIEGIGNAPKINETTGAYVNEPVSKLDIMARAAAINADLWAKDEINVITGANTINYTTLAVTPIENPPADKKPDLALDIAALGGMYAGKIQLVGTEKGLGFNVQGNINASNNLAITNDGKITFTQNNRNYIGEDGKPYTSPTEIASEGSIQVTSTDAIENKGQIDARKDITINAGSALTNQGTIQAGAAYEQNEDDPDSPIITEAADLKMTSGSKIVNTGMVSSSKNVTVSGQNTFDNSGQVIAEKDLNIIATGTLNSTGMLTAGGAVTLQGEKVKYNPLSVTGATINVTQTNPATEPEKPDPEPDPKPDTPKPTEKDTKVITITSEIPAIPDLPDVAVNSSPAATVRVAKDDSLRLTADVGAAGKYQPIIDKAANGVDLVQIAQVNANGVSRNLYTDFNIKSTGLILNNSAKYVKTELGGYIDRNMNIAGNGASVILNEITSSNASALNGYLEVAGNKASVVIANANGISVNGLGFINTTNAVLSTAKVSQWENGNITFGVPHSNLLIYGDGLNARTTAGLNLITNQFTVDKSEIWAQDLNISAEGTLKNTGKISAGQNITFQADRLVNRENGYVEAAGNIAVTVNKDITQDAATLQAGGNITVSGQTLQNKNNAMINGKGNIAITVAGDVDNTKSIVKADRNLSIQADNFSNTDTAVVAYGQNSQLDIQNKFTNNNATINGNGSSVIQATDVENINNAVLNTNQNLTITASNSIINEHATVRSGNNAQFGANTFANTNNGYISAGKQVAVDTRTSLQNQKATLKAGATADFTAETFTNENTGYITSGQAMHISAKTVKNDAASIKSQDDLTVKSDTLTNKNNALIYSQNDGTYNITQAIMQDHSIWTTGGDADITAASFSSVNGASLVADGNLTLQTSGDILNDASTIGSGKTGIIVGDNITNQNSGAVFITGNMDITAQKTFANTKGLIAGGSTADITAQTINNTKNSVLYAGGDITLTAAGTVLNQSSDIESQGNIKIKATDVVNEKEIFETAWIITDQPVSYKIPYAHMGGRYYKGVRAFNRNIHTGNITQETADSHIVANGNIDIQGNLFNHYSTISAGKDLTITGNKIENWGYQGTIKHDDFGNDTYYWKYKKHRKWHHHCHMVYGETIEPYTDHNVYEQETERLSVLGANGKVTLNAPTIDNKTFDAGREVITFKTKKSSTTITDKLNRKTIVNLAGKTAGSNELDISALKINTLMYKLNSDPSAKYMIETNEKFANYHNFLSSDYLLNRVKSDPEKVAKRLGDGYYEQKLVTEQLTNLTGKRFLNGYSSELEQYKALMENGAVAAEKMGLSLGVGLTAEQVASLTSDIVWLVEKTVNGQKVLVPEVYLATIKAEDLKESGALIVGGDIELYAKQNITNIGTIKADKTLIANAENLTNLHGKLTGSDINLTARNTIKNVSGEISGKNDVSLKANNIVNQTETQTTQYRQLQQTVVGDTALITAGKGSLSLDAKNDIVNQGAVLNAGKDVTLKAGNNIDIASVAAEKHVAVTYSQSSVSLDTVKNQQSVIGGSNITIDAGRDINLSGALTSAQEKTAITAGQDITITAVKDLDSLDSSVGKRSGYSFDHDKTVDETVVGTQIGGTKDITISAKKDIAVTGSSIGSEKGKTELTGASVTISGETEYHEKLHEEHREKVGFLSSTKTDIYDRQTLEAVVGSNISGNSASLTATGKDITINGSSVVADNDVKLKAQGNVNIISQEETSSSDYRKQVKKSGLLSGGGLGFTIGTQQQKDQLANQNTEQVASTVGSLQGKVDLIAGKDVTVKASDITAQDDITITGKNVAIENADNTYNAQEKHEFKQSGLTVSLESQTLNTVNQVYQPLKRASEVSDDRLKALYVYKAGEEYKKTQAAEKAKAQELQKQKEAEANQQNKNAADSNAAGNTKEAPKPKKSDLSISISLGSSKSESRSDSQTIAAQGSNIKTEGNVTIKATEGDIKVKGSTIEGKNVDLKAKENIEIAASENKNTTNSQNKSSSASIGVSINLGTGGVGGITAGANKQNGEIKENGITYNESGITAKDTLTMESGKDTAIIGSKAAGNTVKVNAGENLNIESLQDKESYDEKNKSAGINLGTGGISGSASKGKIKSNYESVTEQAGIYAGKGGFDINVGKNTDLKGAVISSEATPDKNKLDTGSLSWKDIKNKAEYDSSSSGVSIDTSKDAKYNEKGVTPNIGVTAKGDSDSTTKSAVSEGTIEVRSNPHQDLSGLSRDTTNSLNALGKIFDKKTVQEKQELAALFGEIAFEEVHKISEKNGWKDGSPEKVALHAVVGGIMSQLTGSGFKSGAIGASVNELVQKELKEKFKDQPDVWQWASYVIGAAAAKAAGGDAQAGGSAAASGTKNNAQGFGKPIKINDPTIISSFIIAGVALNVKKAIDGTVYLVNEAGKAIATWNQEDEKWITNTEAATINQQYIDTLNNNIEAANRQIAASDKTIQSVTETIQDVKQLTAQMQTRIAELQTQIANTNAETAQLQAEITQLQSDVNDRLKTVENLEASIALLKAQIANLRSKIYPPGIDQSKVSGPIVLTNPKNNPTTSIPSTDGKLQEPTSTSLPGDNSSSTSTTPPPISNDKSTIGTGVIIATTGEINQPGPNGKFENADYHGKVGNNIKSKAPQDGQFALDNSVLIKETANRRVGIDSDGNFVVLDKTSDGIFHGHVREWNSKDPNMQPLTSEMKKALKDAGLVTEVAGKGKLTEKAIKLIEERTKQSNNKIIKF